MIQFGTWGLPRCIVQRFHLPSLLVGDGHCQDAVWACCLYHLLPANPVKVDIKSHWVCWKTNISLTLPKCKMGFAVWDLHQCHTDHSPGLLSILFESQQAQEVERPGLALGGASWFKLRQQLITPWWWLRVLSANPSNLILWIDPALALNVLWNICLFIVTKILMNGNIRLLNH